MRRLILAAAGLSLFLVVQQATFASGQDVQDEEVGTRGAFFATRPSGAGGSQKAGAGKKGAETKKSANQSASKTKPKSSSAASKSNKAAAGAGEVNTTAAAGAKEPAGANATTAAGATSPTAIGLGYTLYMRDANGDAVRVDPRREFNQGEGIRIALETNTDGYLYVFHTEDGRDPQMLFPHRSLNEGENYIVAHRLYQVPPILNKWFEFDERPAVERLYVVLTRKPLGEVPAGAALLKFCEGGGDDCYWKPTTAVWSKVEAETKGRVLTSRSEESLGRAQTSNERDALTRGIKLSKADPAPAVLHMNASPTSAFLVATIDLVHK